MTVEIRSRELRQLRRHAAPQRVHHALADGDDHRVLPALEQSCKRARREIPDAEPYHELPAAKRVDKAPQKHRRYERRPRGESNERECGQTFAWKMAYERQQSRKKHHQHFLITFDGLHGQRHKTTENQSNPGPLPEWAVAEDDWRSVEGREKQIAGLRLRRRTFADTLEIIDMPYLRHSHHRQRGPRKPSTGGLASLEGGWSSWASCAS